MKKIGIMNENFLNNRNYKKYNLRKNYFRMDKRKLKLKRKKDKLNSAILAA